MPCLRGGGVWGLAVALGALVAPRLAMATEQPLWEYGLGGGAVFWSLTLNPTLTPFWGSWRGRQILNAGEQLVVATDASADFMASGYLLSLP